MQKFSVKCEVLLVNQLTLALRAAEGEGERIALGVANARARSSAAWEEVSGGRIAVKSAVQRLSDLTKAAREDASIDALLAPLEDYVHAAREELGALEATHDAESRILRSLEEKAATNRCLISALTEALAVCEVEGSEERPEPMWGDDPSDW